MQAQRGVVTEVTYAPTRHAVALRVQPEDLGADMLVHFQGHRPLAGRVAEGDTIELYGKQRLVDLTTDTILEHHSSSSRWPVLVVVVLIVAGLIASQGPWKTMEPPRNPIGAGSPSPSSLLVVRRPPIQGEEV